MAEQEKALVPATKEVVAAPRGNTRAMNFNPTTFQEACTWAKMIASSDLAPKDYRGKPGNVLVALQMGAEVGLQPMAALQNIAVINGRPSVWGDAALGIVQASNVYESHKEWIEGDGDNAIAYCEVKRKGQEAHKVSFSVNDAKKAGLWGKESPWKTYPKRMLQMRARGFALRDQFADVMRGLILAEEALDIPVEIVKRVTGTLDVSKQLGALVESSEPNRGHGNEGMEQRPAPPVEQAAEEVKNPTSRHATVTVKKFEIKTRKATQAEIEKAKAESRKVVPQEYLLCEGVEMVDEQPVEFTFYVWDKALCEAVLEAAEKGYVLNVELHKNDKGKEALAAIVDRVAQTPTPEPEKQEGPPTAAELFK